MKYYQWWPADGSNSPSPIPLWYLELELKGLNELDFRRASRIDNWDVNTTAYYEGDSKITDYVFTIPQLPVYSEKLKQLMARLKIDGIQYLPLSVRHRESNTEIKGYSIANYLHIVDCLDRQNSHYQVWTKENLLFWEERPHKLGTFRSITKYVLDSTKINVQPIFRLWGHTSTIFVREDIRNAIEDDGITGCLFGEREVR